MPKAVVVTPAELLEVLERSSRSRRDAKVVSITVENRPRLSQRGRISRLPCPFPSGVTHLTRRRVTIGASYQAEVNRQREAEGLAATFKAGRLWGGQGVRVGRFAVKHKGTGRLYLVGIPEAVTGSIFIDNETLEAVDADAVEEFLPEPRAADRQGLEQPVEWRTIALDNVREVIYRDVRYELRHAPAAVAVKPRRARKGARAAAGKENRPACFGQSAAGRNERTLDYLPMSRAKCKAAIAASTSARSSGVNFSPRTSGRNCSLPLPRRGEGEAGNARQGVSARSLRRLPPA